MEQALHDIRMLRTFAGLDAVVDSIPNETTFLRFRHLLERNGLAAAMLDKIYNRYQRAKAIYNALPGRIQARQVIGT